MIEWSSKGNPRRINYADEHLTKKLQDFWTFKDPVRPIYPTEKNHEMLETIIKASSDENSIVMDCFAGSGGTLVEANLLNRRWIGVDRSETAIAIVRKNFEARCTIVADDYEFIGWMGMFRALWGKLKVLDFGHLGSEDVKQGMRKAVCGTRGDVIPRLASMSFPGLSAAADADTGISLYEVGLSGQAR